ncbi:HECT-domain-containing protein-like protein [Amylocarpus encephaloides]|uniref:HECT-type E3 ubiquitin transferase n=1 Tax=Amylocarpus encephaloides TaxID=45428 RepID=A0A9P7YFZ6_9HELO|nr:HECT-domain-containing protein-like protein [Amylocarpus encephaloides]
MTRDIQGLGLAPRDGQDPINEDGIYAALWATASFPRLPDDAPEDLKDFLVDVDDPKHIYTIHRAARRYEFQILVERYISQIRYGCKVKTCTTATCFSCRKRLAAGAPVRRYNTTSARTLAIHLASQDDPDRGLCHHPSAERPISQPQAAEKKKSRGSYRFTESSSNTSTSTFRRSEKLGVEDWEAKGYPRKRPSSHTLGVNPPDDKETKPASTGVDEEPIVSLLREPTATDHRSFVQNVFGTVTFKMIEWLTPRSLEMLSRPLEASSSLRESNKFATNGPAIANEISTEPTKDDTKIESEDSKPASPTDYSSHKRETSSTKTSHSKTCSTETLTQPLIPVAEAKPLTNSVTKRSSKIQSRRRSETVETPGPKGILNISSRTTDTPDMLSLSRYQPNPPKRTLSTSHQTLITNPLPHPGLDNSSPARKIAGKKSLPEASSYHIIEETVVKTEQETPLPRKPSTKKVVKKLPEEETLLLNEATLPQSLSLLPIDVLNFLCDKLQADITLSSHDLRPIKVSEGWKKWLNKDSPYRLYHISDSTPTVPFSKPPSPENAEWKSFIEQAFFGVLSRSDSLIQSFSYCDQRLFDTQTLWYLMIRLTRASPSLVFDSLWIAAGDLFNPPESLESMQDWGHKSQSLDASHKKSLSNNEAARLINICLHALVATAPLVEDARQLANMSRIRSYGLAMLGREKLSLEPVELCLRYEDAFTDELALRLARRIFSSISTRQTFNDLTEHQKDVPTDGKKEPDVLEIVLATLKFLDLGITPTLDFSDEERDLHEKRVPTLLLDWARTIMIQDWNGFAAVPADGSFGGALAMIAAIYKHRKSLLLGDIHFRTEYFAERLDPVSMPLEWVSFEQNKKSNHLLDYPYLFNPSTLVTYFRAINYSRMNQAYETAKANNGLMHSTISENSLMTDQSARLRLFERLRTATSKFLVLEIGRQGVLVDTFNSIWRKEERELMRPLKVRLGEDAGEEGMDSGGVQQEFFRLAIAEALDPNYGTFTIDSRTKMTWFQPGSPEPLWKFQLVGTIMSLAVYNGLTLPVTFPKALYRRLLDQDVAELHHIADGWPDLANGLTSLLEWDEKDGQVEDIFARTYEFSVDQFGEPVSRDMGDTTSWPQFSELHTPSNPEDAPMVTNENRNNYVSDYIRWLTDVSVRPQYEAFKTGFFTCLDRRSLSLFDPDTLQSVVEGIQEIDISEMRRATRYIGWDSSHRSVRDFWSIVRRYDLKHKRRLLEFVTASDRVPVGGMRNLQFTLQRNGTDDGHLPSSYTCYGILLLPEYSSKDILREKLAMALENSKGFGFA